MKKTMYVVLPAVFLLSTAITFRAQTPAGAQDAIYITNGDINAMIKANMPGAAKEKGKAPGSSDIMMRMVNAGPVNLGVSVLQYANGSRMINDQINTQLHRDTPEVYYVVKGSGTMLTGSAIENGKDSNIKQLVGVGFGGVAKGGNKHKITAGDVIIVPTGVPHVVIDATDDITFLIVRVDTKKVVDLK